MGNIFKEKLRCVNFVLTEKLTNQALDHSEKHKKDYPKIK